ncbi:bifunctional UDP-sugar hydrolase/5'-nucleotidase [Atlantibacter sp.]|uniref:bifunctional metallophosphatase/5'-nucleotidase n=1 Tax=Atlantibacter sp. TaxID=1903473 RepID=UPI0028AEB310|nr:bifunctional UDP-sugar hydrolase/5'-nucleotidase [Atlantibacter sp.]
MKAKYLSLALLAGWCAQGLAQDVTVIYTNDLHAHVEPYSVPWIADGKRPVGGFATISTLVKQEKARNPTTFYFDAGDYFTGPYISSLTKGKAIIDILNTMSVDAASVGNHEFDHGWDYTLLQLSQATFPILLGNVFYQNSQVPFWNKPYTILEKDGIKIGVIGLHGVFAFDDTVSAAMRQGIEARDEVKWLQHYLDELRGKVDITVALMHEGIPARQSSKGSTDVKRALDNDIQTAGQVKGLDLLITGHAHVGTPEPIKVGNTLILSTDSGGIDIGKLVLDVNPKTCAHTEKSFELKTLFADEWRPDPVTQQTIDKWNKQLQQTVSQPIGETPIALTRAYGESSSPGNLFTDAMIAAAPDAQLAVTNSGGLRADINAGKITLGDVISAFPFPNELTVMDLNGKQVRNLMEHSASLTNGVWQASKGVMMRYDTHKAPGARVTELTLNGKPIEDNQVYRVATNSFLAPGGDGFMAFTEGKNKQVRGGYNLSGALIDYLKAGNKIDPAVVNEKRVEEVK